MKYARIDSYSPVVAEVFTPPPGFQLTDCFTPDIVAQFQPCADDVVRGWLVQEDGTFAVAPEPEPPSIEPEPLPLDAELPAEDTLNP
jgi:hypothetical protein